MCVNVSKGQHGDQLLMCVCQSLFQTHNSNWQLKTDGECRLLFGSLCGPVMNWVPGVAPPPTSTTAGIGCSSHVTVSHPWISTDRSRVDVGTDGWMDRLTDEWVDAWMDGWMDR